MLLPYHIEVLDKVIKTAGKNGWIDPDVKWQSKDMLKRGMYYPDMPCGKRMLLENRIVNLRMRPCGTGRFINLLLIANQKFLKTSLSEVYMSHNGPFSYMHAMAPPGDLPIQNVRDAIVTKCLIFFALALHDDVTLRRTTTTAEATASPPGRGALVNGPNLFWLGQVLHVVMDSYTPAHTHRAGVDAGCVPTEKEVEKVAPPVPKTSSLTWVHVHGVIKRLSTKVFANPAEIDREIVACLPQLAHKLKTLKTVRNLLYMIMFDDQIIQRYDIASKVKGAKLYSDKPFAVQRFYKYAQQSALSHMQYDTKGKMIECGLYAECVQRCIDVVRMYAKYRTLSKISDNTIHDALAEFCEYLTGNVFHVASAGMGMKSSSSTNGGTGSSSHG